VGMAGAHQSDLPVPAAVLRPGQIVVDLVYNPLQTALMATARSRGLEAHNGLGMLVFQAGHAFGQWTGVNPPIDVMYSAARRGVAPAIS